MNKNTVYKRTLSQAKERLTIVQEQEKEFNKQVSNNNKQIKQISIKNKKLAKKISSHMKYMNQLVSEITEKSKKEEHQWEILAYNNYNEIGSGGGIRAKKDDGLFYFTTGINQSPFPEFELSRWNIHSVKRLPDNTVWSVDMVTGQGKIESFKILDDKVNLMSDVAARLCDKKNRGKMAVKFTDCHIPNTLLESLTEAPKEEQVPIKVHSLHHLGENSNDAATQIVTSHRIPPSKYQSIKSAIEDVLNEDKIKHEKLLSKIESKVRLANMINTQANYLKETLDYINSLK